MNKSLGRIKIQQIALDRRLALIILILSFLQLLNTNAMAIENDKKPFSIFQVPSLYNNSQVVTDIKGEPQGKGLLKDVLPLPSSARKINFDKGDAIQGCGSPGEYVTLGFVIKSNICFR